MCLRQFLETSLSCMFLTKCSGQNDRIDRGIISRFRRNNAFSWRNVTKKRIRVGFPLSQLLYNWCISSCMRNTDTFILEYFCSSPPGRMICQVGRPAWPAQGSPHGSRGLQEGSRRLQEAPGGCRTLQDSLWDTKSQFAVKNINFTRRFWRLSSKSSHLARSLFGNRWTSHA